MELDIQHDIDRRRFFAEIDGATAHLDYREAGPKKLDYKHTFVPEELRGEGVGGRLVKHALEYAKEKGFEVIPSCPFVESYVEEHPEYRELTA